MDFGPLLSTDGLLSLVTLSAMEVVLGLDNIVFLSILVGKLPKAQQALARQLGLGLALGSRLLLLFVISWVMGLKTDFFSLFGHGFSGRDLILIGGGFFLVAKATKEIHEKLEDDGQDEQLRTPRGSSFPLVLAQVTVLDVVFSLDSVITAVGMAEHLIVMVTAMLIAVGVMLVFARSIGEFVEDHPTTKMLALSFLILIGVMLVVDGMGQHVSKAYIYFAMAFSFGVELINLRLHKVRKKKSPSPAAAAPEGASNLPSHTEPRASTGGSH